MTTLHTFTLEQQYQLKGSFDDWIAILEIIQQVAQTISHSLNQAAIIHMAGVSCTKNVHNEKQMKLDLWANQQFKNAFKSQKYIAGMASEEEEKIVTFYNAQAQQANYVLLIDPLDGSDNIDTNASVGTIFCIYRRACLIQDTVTLSDFLQSGKKLLAAGYFIYGPSTMLVYSIGDGVHGFTYNTSQKTFYLTHPRIKIPARGTTYSVNEGNRNQFSLGVQHYLASCQIEDNIQGKPFSTRYTGCLVADFHRNLLKGGIYIYPSSTKYSNGKLRLLYECNPMAFLAEQAGGLASDGRQRTLEIQPTALHQRTPLFIGSKHMVESLMHFVLS